MLWRALKLLAVAFVGVTAALNATDSEFTLRAGVARRLAGAHGNIAACYTPFHNDAYPLGNQGVNLNALRAALDDDFKFMSQYFTHVRTYHAMHYDIQVAPIAAKYGIKLYLGVMIDPQWQWAENKAVVDAIKYHSDTVEAVLVGNENMKDVDVSWVIMKIVNDIKGAAGADAWRVKYGTVQRAHEYIHTPWKMKELAKNLDILGINIYPCFNNGYYGGPTKLLDDQWRNAIAQFPDHHKKFRLTETGFSTGGDPSGLSPNVKPDLGTSMAYYNEVVSWSPPGVEDTPKFWFQAFDRRLDDPFVKNNPKNLEIYFGFFNTKRGRKADNFPRFRGDNSQPAGQVEAGDVSGGGCDTLQKDLDFTGNDLVSKRGPDATSCFGICKAHPGCKAFSWNGDNGGTCWLKSGMNSFTTKTGVTSGQPCLDSPSTPNCPIVEGMDYEGDGPGSAKSKDASGCFKICREKGAACKAFVWNNYQGGTCWFKSSTEKTVKKSDVWSSVMSCANPVPAPTPTTQEPTPTTQTPTPTPTTECPIEDGFDYEGDGPGSAKSKDASGCFKICRDKGAACKAFVWNNYQDGTCWFKSSTDRKVKKSDVKSSVMFCANPGPAPAPSCGIVERGVDYIGNDVGKGKSVSPNGCFDVCAKHAGCGAFSWNGDNGGTCWLKSGKGATTTNPNVNSGVKCSSSVNLERNVDYSGAAVGNSSGKEAKDCVDRCLANANCKAFSWSDYQGGTCWLKNGKGNAFAKTGVVSAVVRA